MVLDYWGRIVQFNFLNLDIWFTPQLEYWKEKQIIEVNSNFDENTIQKRLKVLRADIKSDKGWIKTLHGVDFLLHVAFLFPLEELKVSSDYT